MPLSVSSPRKRGSAEGRAWNVSISSTFWPLEKNGTLYIGVTNDLARRVWEHRNGTADGFTKRYSVTTLVYIEMFSDITEAIAREKAMKKWRRAWKIELIEQHNPEWRDLFETINS